MATYVVTVKDYQPSPKPVFESSKEQWLEDELRRLREVIQSLKEAIDELRSENP